MSDPGFTRPDLFSIPAAEQAQLTTAVRGLLSADSYPSACDHPLAPRTRDADRTLVEAAFTLHHCHRHDPLCWLGGAYPMPIPPESGTGPTDVRVSWATHDLLTGWDWCATYSHTRQLTNAVPGSVLDVFGELDRRRGIGSTCLETSHRGQRMETGR
jgi:hypothetical protein